MRELDANIIVDGQKVVATTNISGEIVKDGGSIDATSVIKTAKGLQNVVKVLDISRASSLDDIIIKSNAIPQASAENKGRMYIYSGATNQTFTHGCIYENQYDANYDWRIMFNLDSDTHKLAFDYENHSVSEIFERIADLSSPSFDPKAVSYGTFKLDKVNELWYISGHDKTGNVLFENFTFSATGDEYSLDAYGFIYINHFPDDYEENYTETFNLEIEETASNFHWVKILP